MAIKSTRTAWNQGDSMESTKTDVGSWDSTDFLLGLTADLHACIGVIGLGVNSPSGFSDVTGEPFQTSLVTVFE
jgi:hypothetical protein